MNPIIWFSIIGVSCLIVFLPRFIASRVNRERDTPGLETEPFSFSAYFDRMEQDALEIMERQEPIDQTIILWWGLDGLRLNEDGMLEWISRKKPKPVMQNVFYQPCQSIQADVESQLKLPSQTQSTRAQIEELMMRNAALQNQAAQYMQSVAVINQLTPPMMPVSPYYSPYMQPPYLRSYVSREVERFIHEEIVQLVREIPYYKI